MTARTRRWTMPAITATSLGRIGIILVHAVTGMGRLGRRFCGQLDGHHAGLSSSIQPPKHKRPEDDSTPRRYKRLIFSSFRQNHPSSGVTVESLDAAGKTGNYPGHNIRRLDLRGGDEQRACR